MQTEVHLSVPFFSNTPDNYHCFQAALRIVLAYYLPDREYNWQELDEITAHTADYTWPLAGLLHCVESGLKVENIEPFDYQRFMIEGYSYLEELLGREVADIQKAHSNLEQERKLAAEFVQKVDVEKRVPLIEDIQSALMERRLVICNINARVFQQLAGYTGHFVVVIGGNTDGIWLHDPGLPPVKDRFTSWGEFDRAWSYPDENARNIMAIYRP
mgnify:CR=1 FL=1